MGMGMRAMARLGGGIAATALAAIFAAPAMAQDLLGQPTPAGIGFQPAAAPLAHEAHFFHNVVLMPIITAICREIFLQTPVPVFSLIVNSIFCCCFFAAIECFLLR